MTRVISWNAWHMLAGVLFIFTSLAYLPGGLFKGLFDRNASPQFVALCLTTVILGVRLIISRKKISLSPAALFSGVALLVIAIISWVSSHNLITGLTGETGRYTGLASLFALILIATYFSRLTKNEFSKTLKVMLVGVLLLDLLGLLQDFKVIKLPTGGGVGSTLGNLDFLSAWLGTTFLLFALVDINQRIKRIGLALLAIVSTFLMIQIGAKQGLLDFILIALAIGAYQLRNRLPKLVLSRNIWTSFFTFATLLWCEIVYLVPIARLPIPGVAGDVNVTIRSDFWYSGGAMFFHNLWLGVGPDNYGYFYEKYRSLSSVKKTESVISNDAHSAMVQSMATLGIFAIIAFVALIVVLIKSLVILSGEEPESKRRYLVFSLFFFIYLTNSLISPMTLPNKFAFWALAGYIIGRASSYGIPKEFNLPIKAISGAMVLIVAFVGVQFTYANLKFALATDKVKESKAIHYKYSPWLPCNIFFGAQMALSLSSGATSLDVAQQAANANPRCIDAQGTIATQYLQMGEYEKAKKSVYQLLDLTPGRRETVRIAAQYSIKANDKKMQAILAQQGIKLGIVTEHN
jgi:hypothetical protein